MDRNMSQCPICESTRIATDGITVEEPVKGIALSSVCQECGISWVDHYRYAGFDIDQGIDPEDESLDQIAAEEDLEMFHLFEENRDQ